MGLYDSFIIWRYCKYCDETLPFGFQTKELGQNLRNYGIGSEIPGLVYAELEVISSCFLCNMRRGRDAKTWEELIEARRNRSNQYRGTAIIKNGILKGIIHIKEIVYD